MNNKKDIFVFFNEEWNEHPTNGDGGDEDFIDGVDTYHAPKEDLTYYDDYEDYGS
jgi:hypothetical protein